MWSNVNNCIDIILVQSQHVIIISSMLRVDLTAGKLNLSSWKWKDWTPNFAFLMYCLSKKIFARRCEAGEFWLVMPTVPLMLPERFGRRDLNLGLNLRRRFELRRTKLQEIREQIYRKDTPGISCALQKYEQSVKVVQNLYGHYTKNHMHVIEDILSASMPKAEQAAKLRAWVHSMQYGWMQS